MRDLVVFNQISMDGYFTDRHGDMSWAHKSDPEWRAFVEENAQGGGELLLGRITYELMASHWPTPNARDQDPKVAERMNHLPKVVFSRTLDRADWNNTKVVKGDLLEEVDRMKNESGKTLVILGSGTLVSQLTRGGLIDEYQIVVNPIVLGDGRTMFEGVEDSLNLRLTRTRTFGNGNLLLCYQPIRAHPLHDAVASLEAVASATSPDVIL
jgi:dihydrofolate reductase